MTAQGWLQIAFYVGGADRAHAAARRLHGARLPGRARGARRALLGPVERLTYRALGTNPEREQSWKGYARTTIVFSALFWLALYVILRSQGIHFFNPTGFNSAPWDVTFNTTSSFVTNTNWQYYGGETTMSYLSQMAGLAVQNFVSAAVGMAVLAAVIRGFARRSARHARQLLGRPHADAALHPAAAVVHRRAACSSPRASCRRCRGPTSFTTAIGGDQTLALGPAASQIAIKQLGTNGGGFFNVNSAMPFENPTQLSNFIEMLFILLIPAALTATFGRMVGSRRQGWTLYAAMLAMFIAGVVVAYPAEQHGSPALRGAGIEMSAERRHAPAATSRTTSSASASPTRRCGRPRRPTRRTGRSTPATRPTPASAAWCRSPTWRPGR